MDPHSSWYKIFTFDVLLRILSSAFLHPLLSFFLPLAFVALSHPFHSTPVRNSIIYVVAVNILYFVRLLNTRLGHPRPAPPDLANGVVVITGGASGLGLLMAEVYALRGVSVAVLDVRHPDDGEELGGGGIDFYHCDVGDARAVAAAVSQIEQDLGRIAVLINNAAVVCPGAVATIPPEDVQKTFATNVFGHVNTVRAILPGMLSSPASPSIIVTISSVLGTLPPAGAGIYSSTKAAVTALHRSLTADLSRAPSSSNIRTILVTVGQMGTSLFAGVQTPSWFWAPVLEPVDVVKEVMAAIEEGRHGEVMLPMYARWAVGMWCLPVCVQRVVRWWSGIDEAMEGFGRGGDKEDKEE